MGELFLMDGGLLVLLLSFLIRSGGSRGPMEDYMLLAEGVGQSLASLFCIAQLDSWLRAKPDNSARDPQGRHSAEYPFRLRPPSRPPASIINDGEGWSSFAHNQNQPARARPQRYPTIVTSQQRYIPIFLPEGRSGHPDTPPGLESRMRASLPLVMLSSRYFLTQPSRGGTSSTGPD